MPWEPAISDFSQWVPWRVERCEMPEWWVELSAIPGKEDTRKLTREMRAFFGLPRQLQELDSREATLQAPPAPPCLCRKRFMLPADSIFACRDIREVPREKVVEYSRALQYWAEQNNPPAGGEPHLLAKSVQEVRQEVKWYLLFTNEEIFGGWPFWRGKKRRRIQGPLLSPLYPRCPACQGLPWKRELQGFLDGRRCCIHPDQWWLLGISPTDQDTEAEGGIKPALPNDTNKATSLPSKDPYSTSALSVNASLGDSLTVDSTMWLLWSGSLSVGVGYVTQSLRNANVL